MTVKELKQTGILPTVGDLVRELLKLPQDQRYGMDDFCGNFDAFGIEWDGKNAVYFSPECVLEHWCYWCENNPCKCECNGDEEKCKCKDGTCDCTRS